MKYFSFSILIIIGILLNGCTASKKTTVVQVQPIYAFDFGTGDVADGYTQVDANVSYNNEIGYGFTSKGTLTNVNRESGSDVTSDFVTSDEPFYFEMKLPEGNYFVELQLGDPKGMSSTTVKAESRRLMLEEVNTESGNTVTKSFTVNVRTARINDSVSIRLKSRELGYLNYDDKLSIEFNGKRPCIAGIKVFPQENIPVIYLAGNSTVTDQEEEPWASWGQMFPRFLKPGIAVANYAESGEALKSFRGRRRLQKITSIMKPGDYLFIEFAHNDQKKKSGAYVEAWTTYTDQLKYFINEARAKGGQPVLVTSMHRRVFDENGEVVNTLEDYPAAMRALAKEENLPLIDLNAMSKVFYEAMGPEHSKVAFVHYPAGTFPGQDKALADNTHFSTYGAYELAKCIIEGIKLTNLGINDYIIDGLPTFNPAQPDPFEEFDLPRSPASSIVKPDGN